MKPVYIFLMSIVFYVSYAAETSSLRARPRPTPLQTPASKRLSGNFSSPRGFPSPKGNRASPGTPKTADSASSSPGDAAAYTQTIIPDLYNRIQGFPQLLEKELADQTVSQERITAILSLIEKLHNAGQQLLSLTEDATKLEPGHREIAERLGSKKSGKLSGQEQAKVDSLIVFFNINLKPRIAELELKHKALKLAVKRTVKRPGSA
ncbi:MAG: hypothetical protein K2X90_04335 [Candidatus Babeliaceae bacterium]|nr:hypothetical protein [Candidatus Babeliaceae bacterium]